MDQSRVLKGENKHILSSLAFSCWDLLLIYQLCHSRQECHTFAGALLLNFEKTLGTRGDPSDLQGLGSHVNLLLPLSLAENMLTLKKKATKNS